MQNTPGAHSRIVLTGGPGAGKTTAADLLRRELGDQVVVVPEAATILFSGGFPRYQEDELIKSTQKAIYHVQKNLEKVQLANFPQRSLLCDRGTIDGSVYWPGGPEIFFSNLGTSFQKELDRYDAVVFFESAAVGHMSIEGGNKARIESLEEAVKLDSQLKEIWRQHPHFHFIPHNKSFIKKITQAHETIMSLL